MKPNPTKHWRFVGYRKSTTRLLIQAPLPGFLDILPILTTIEGRGTVNGGTVPSAPPGQPHPSNRSQTGESTNDS